MKNNKRKQFLVAGLGLFGSSVALTLKEMDYDVLCIDIDENVVQDYSSNFTYTDFSKFVFEFFDKILVHRYICFYFTFLANILILTAITAN